MAEHPYSAQPSKAFWNSAVASKNYLDISELWPARWPVDKADRVVTFGSCFAQHFGAALKERGYGWTSYERPSANMSPRMVEKYNYNVFSARTGNIYTTTLLEQWISWAVGRSEPPSEVWEKGGRFYDPFRPRIEPNGFASPEELRHSRDATIAALRQCMEAEIFVFTLGLTESWYNADEGHEYAMCPGTVAGEFDPLIHRFRNLTFSKVRSGLVQAIADIRSVNPDIRFLLTVSPVPLTATATQEHVLVASSRSKSVLRAVAGEVSDDDAMIDYFPSYEIISAPPYRGSWFEPNQRSVNPNGVAHVMSQFFAGQAQLAGEEVAQKAGMPAPLSPKTNVVCEEQLLAAFGGAR